MKLPWRSLNEKAAITPTEETSDRGPQKRSHRSPGLLEALGSLRTDGKSSVLDLGPLVGDNIAFFSERAARVQIVDVLRSGGALGSTAEILKVLQELEPSRAKAFDLVLAWDVLDYVAKDKAAVLVDLVAQLCRPDARLHLVVSGSDTMPARPTRYRIIDAENLSYERIDDEIVGSPNQTPAVVEKILHGFRIEHSFVLRHGVHEYVAARSG